MVETGVICGRKQDGEAVAQRRPHESKEFRRRWRINGGSLQGVLNAPRNALVRMRQRPVQVEKKFVNRITTIPFGTPDIVIGERRTGRTGLTLRHGHEPVGSASGDGGIVGAKGPDPAEVMLSQQRIELVLLPAPHHEVIVADAFDPLLDKRVPFRYQESPRLRIERGDTRERQLTPFSDDALSEQRLACLPVRRRVPLPDVENEHAVRHSAARTPQRRRDVDRPR